MDAIIKLVLYLWYVDLILVGHFGCYVCIMWVVYHVRSKHCHLSILVMTLQPEPQQQHEQQQCHAKRAEMLQVNSTLPMSSYFRHHSCACRMSGTAWCADIATIVQRPACCACQQCTFSSVHSAVLNFSLQWRLCITVSE